MASAIPDAGANEPAVDRDGFTPRDAIVYRIDRNDLHCANLGDGAAICGMLDRGPAYRARSWAWPLDLKAGDVGTGDSDHDNVVALAVVALLPSLPAMKTPPVHIVSITRPKEKSNTSR